MAYYTGLINAWNSVTQPPTGVTGTPLTGLTTANKIIAINGWTITGSIPTVAFTTADQIFNCLVFSEVAALTATESAHLDRILHTAGSLKGGSASTYIAPFFGSVAAKMPNTLTALTALSKALVLPWWQVPQASSGGGLNSPVNESDLVAAGGLT